MSRHPILALLLLFVPLLCPKVDAQDSVVAQPSPVRLAVGDPNTGNASTVVIAPATSWSTTVELGSATTKASKASDISSWLKANSVLNGLVGLDVPWHILIAYEQFDEDGDKIHSGTYEELWAAPKKFRIIYKADDLNQTDYATPHGLYRVGDQRWPNRAQAQIPNEVINPFFYAASLQGVRVRNSPQRFGNSIFQCAAIERASGGFNSPTQYCFETNDSQLRYVRGGGWYQTTYNDVESFAGRFVAHTINVYDGGKPYLTLHVQLLETLSAFTDADFAPPSDAKNLSGQRLSGVAPVAISQVFPEWPDSLRGQHFSVTVEIVIGKDGHVISAHAISGQQNAFKAAEATVRKWTFQPYTVLDEPTEVVSKIILSNN